MRTITLLILLSSLLAACGSNTPDPTISPEETIEVLEKTPVALGETYTGSNELTESALTLNYPAGWFAQGNGVELLLTNADPESATSPSEGEILVTVRALQGAALPQSETPITSPQNLLEAIKANETAFNLGDITTFTLDGKDAAQASGSNGEAHILTYVLQFADDAYVLVIALTANAPDTQAQATIEAMAASVQYEPGAIPDGGN
jgi:hypothetical protein